MSESLPSHAVPPNVFGLAWATQVPEEINTYDIIAFVYSEGEFICDGADQTIAEICITEGRIDWMVPNFGLDQEFEPGAFVEVHPVPIDLPPDKFIIVFYRTGRRSEANVTQIQELNEFFVRSTRY